MHAVQDIEQATNCDCGKINRMKEWLTITGAKNIPDVECLKFHTDHMCKVGSHPPPTTKERRTNLPLGTHSCCKFVTRRSTGIAIGAAAVAGRQKQSPRLVLVIEHQPLIHVANANAGFGRLPRYSGSRSVTQTLVALPPTPPSQCS